MRREPMLGLAVAAAVLAVGRWVSDVAEAPPQRPESTATVVSATAACGGSDSLLGCRPCADVHGVMQLPHAFTAAYAALATSCDTGIDPSS
jgi:hypothetical protein